MRPFQQLDLGYVPRYNQALSRYPRSVLGALLAADSRTSLQSNFSSHLFIMLSSE